MRPHLVLRSKINARSVLVGAVVGVLFVWFLYSWNESFTQSNWIVVYFGRPTDVSQYFFSNWYGLLMATLYCFLTASGSLLFAGVITIPVMAFGLSSDGRLHFVERLGAVSQTVPLIVIVLVSLFIQGQLFSILGIRPAVDWYCVLPVTVALLFPPLANAAQAVVRMPVQIKGLLRIWNAPTAWRIWWVYIPSAIPDMLTGLRASATWAVAATLIAEGLLNGVEGDSTTLGHALLRPFSSAPPGRTPVVIVIATGLGFAVYALFVQLQRLIENRLLGRMVLAEGAYPLQSRCIDRENKIQEKKHAPHK